MIVRVSARGQANSSADGYLCATQLGQAERRVQKRRSCGYQVLPGTETCLISDTFSKDLREIFRAHTENCMPSGASGGARSHGWRVHGCRGTRVPWNENHVRLVLYAPSPCGWAVSLGLRWGQNIIMHDKTNKNLSD